jgi:hypothetical protein
MKPRLLLVNPPVYDFAAYDFWLKPYGLLQAAGFLRGQADMHLFDYLDRHHPVLAADAALRCDRWGRGSFPEQRIPKPACLRHIPRHFRRFGWARERFQAFLQTQDPFDAVLIQTMMTYWYPGVAEVMDDIRTALPQAQIILGGNYVTLCPDHAAGLGADRLVPGNDLSPLWQALALEPDVTQPGLWETYPNLRVGAMKLTQGCPFQCSYCAVPPVYGAFRPRPVKRSLAEYGFLQDRGARHIAFYDDALLFQPDTALNPLLELAISRGAPIDLHSPNALNARFLTRGLARRMVQAGFKTFYLGFESVSRDWQRATGGKVEAAELTEAVAHLRQAGVAPTEITAYQILGHPRQDLQELEASMTFVRDLGILGVLADFSPIPGTPDGDRCAQWVDMSEPLMHNKSVFPVILYGFEAVNRLKDLQRQLNREVRRK